MRIEICGGIASGKTTLARLLSQNKAFGVIYEDFKSNPFWNVYFSDPLRFYFETETTFCLQHYHSIKVEYDKNYKIICDYALLQDKAYALIGIGDNPVRMEIFNSIFKEISAELDEPNIVIYLDCAEETLLKRIRQRGRKEEENITIEYLRKLNNNIFEQLKSLSSGTQIITIDSNAKDFANDKSVQSEIVNLVFEHSIKNGAI